MIIYFNIACSHRMYMGVVLGTHSVRGESHIQCNANGEFATTVNFPIAQHLAWVV